MTNPNHTDTSRSGDLVAAMKDQIESWEFEDPRETWWKWQHQYAQAAARIEALEAEIERLRAAGNDLATIPGHSPTCGWEDGASCTCGYSEVAEAWGRAALTGKADQ